LQPEDGVDGDRFGCAVAAAGNRIVVGAFEAPHAGFGDQGAAYVFVRDSGIWSFEAKLVDEDLTYEFFGEDVAIFGDTILVGAQGEREGPGAEQTGAVHVFERDANAWSKVAKLVAPDAESNKGFGDSVAIFENFALIGAPGDGGSFGQRRGAAYMFHRDQMGWKLTGKFSASDGGINDWFGESVALGTDLAVVGAPGHDLPGRADSGSAYLFARSAQNWSELGKLQPSDAAADAAYGTSASIFSGVVAVGSPGDDGSTIHGNAGQGAVYLTDFATPPDGGSVFGDGFEP
jgi:FG-GAP repeat